MTSIRQADAMFDRILDLGREQGRAEAEAEQAAAARAAVAPNAPKPIDSAAAYAQALHDAQSRWQSV